MLSGRSWEDPAQHEDPHGTVPVTAVEAESVPKGRKWPRRTLFFHHDCEVAFVCVATVKPVFLQYYLNLNMYRKDKT